MEHNQIRVVVVGPAPKVYNEVFKRQVVREYEGGVLNKDELMRKYGIGGKSRILEWCRKYGTLAYSKAAARVMEKTDKQRIKALEKALEVANLKVKAYEKVIAITEKEQGIPIVKKPGAKQSTNSDRNTHR